MNFKLGVLVSYNSNKRWSLQGGMQVLKRSHIMNAILKWKVGHMAYWPLMLHVFLFVFMYLCAHLCVAGWVAVAVCTAAVIQTSIVKSLEVTIIFVLHSITVLVDSSVLSCLVTSCCYHNVTPNIKLVVKQKRTCSLFHVCKLCPLYRQFDYHYQCLQI